MAQATREQFDAAAHKVMSTAPAGLSRDDFFALVDKELATLPPAGGTVIGTAQHGATPMPVDEDPSTGGFMMNAAKDGIETLGGIGAGLVDAVSHPIDAMTAIPAGFLHHIKDVASDMHPVQAKDALMAGHPMEALGQLLPVGEAYNKPVGMAADVVGGMQAVKGVKALANAPRTLKAAQLASKVDRYAPSKSGYVAGKFGEAADTGAEQAPIIDRYMPNKSSVGTPEVNIDVTKEGASTPDLRNPNEFNLHEKEVSGARPTFKDPNAAVYDSMMEQMGRDAPAPTPPKHPPLYHVTDASNVESIRANGFDPSRMSPGYLDEEPRPYTFFSENPKVADMLPHNHPNPVTLEVNLPEELRKKLVTDEGEFIRMPERIPPEHIKFPEASAPAPAPDPGATRAPLDPPRAPEPEGRWHAYESEAERRAAPADERARAESLHKSDAELDSRYDYLSDPDNPHSAFMGPEALLAMLTRDLVRSQINKVRRGTMNLGPVRRAVKYGSAAGEGAARLGTVGRFSTLAPRQDKK